MHSPLLQWNEFLLTQSFVTSGVRSNEIINTSIATFRLIIKLKMIIMQIIIMQNNSYNNNNNNNNDDNR